MRVAPCAGHHPGMYLCGLHYIGLQNWASCSSFSPLKWPGVGLLAFSPGFILFRYYTGLEMTYEVYRQLHLANRILVHVVNVSSIGGVIAPANHNRAEHQHQLIEAPTVHPFPQ